MRGLLFLLLMVACGSVPQHGDLYDRALRVLLAKGYLVDAGSRDAGFLTASRPGDGVMVLRWTVQVVFVGDSLVMTARLQRPYPIDILGEGPLPTEGPYFDSLRAAIVRPAGGGTAPRRH